MTINPKKIIIILLIGIAVLSLIILIKRLPISAPILKKDITLTYWGLWEADNVMQPLLDEYKKSHPNITVKYSKQSPIEYRERLQNAIEKGTGPDIFRFHNTWYPMLRNELSNAPPNIVSVETFINNFYPIAEKNLVAGGKIYGIPLEVDSLALFYNEDIFQKAGYNPPTTWEELRRVANGLTVKDSDGRIKIAGAALGTAGNIDHFSDILGIMFLQNGTDMTKVASTIGSDGHNLGEDTLRFYTNFSVLDKVWDETLDRSTVSFAGGKVAMYFGPSWEVFEIKNLNPELRFKVVPIPQLPRKNLNWATYWAEGVSIKSKYKNESWELLNFLSSKESLMKLYDNASKIRLFGEPYSRVDLENTIKSDPMVYPFISQVKNSTSWYLSSRTFDNGLNDKMIKYFEDAVNSINSGEEVIKALQTAEKGVGQVLSQYQNSENTAKP